MVLKANQIKLLSYCIKMCGVNMHFVIVVHTYKAKENYLKHPCLKVTYIVFPCSFTFCSQQYDSKKCAIMSTVSTRSCHPELSTRIQGSIQVASGPKATLFVLYSRRFLTTSLPSTPPPPNHFSQNIHKNKIK